MATLVRWEPLSELAMLQTELSRLMNGLSEGNGRNTQSWVPPVDVWETESDLVYAFDLPGISQDKITLDLHDDTLTVSGERDDYMSGPRTGSSASSGATGASAAPSPCRRGPRRSRSGRDYRNGVLEVRVAKPEVKKPRRIKIGGEADPDLETIEGSASPSWALQARTVV